MVPTLVPDVAAKPQLFVGLQLCCRYFSMARWIPSSHVPLAQAASEKGRIDPQSVLPTGKMIDCSCNYTLWLFNVATENHHF